jgi:predicted nucleic acid-binding protein
MFKNMKSKTFLKAVKQVIDVFHSKGFTISQLLMDGQFESLRPYLNSCNIVLNTTINNG